MRQHELQPATRAVRAGLATDQHHGAVVPPIHLSSTFTFAGFDQPRTYDYTRSGNPTRDLLAEAIAVAEGGAGAVVTSSGMSAVHLALQLVEPGDVVLALRDCYGGTYRLLDAMAKRGSFRVQFVDPTAIDELAAAIVDRAPKMLWLETPSNPLLRVTDIRAAARLASEAGALTVVDNTFLSPALQQPLALGADLVVHSTTKYLNGHSDVVGGAVVAGTEALQEKLVWWANCLGITGSPYDAFLTLRGMRTLHARVRDHERNAQALAERLAQHPTVQKVHYPGLSNHPDHALASAQQAGFGGMLSFELAGGVAAVQAFLDGLTCLTLAESLGGVESLIAHPATMTHASMDPAARQRAGITDGLLRISAGIEATEDLVAEVEDALERAQTATASESQTLRPPVLARAG